MRISSWLHTFACLCRLCHTKANMVQLTKEQRTFVVKTFHETGSLQRTRDRFDERFPERQPPALRTIWTSVRKFSQHGTILNRNKGNSGRRRYGRSEANIEAVRQRLEEQPTGTNARRNGVCHRHQLLPQDYARRMQFAQWLVDRCA